MSHWFHRNPLKATASVKFDLRSIASSGQANKICSDLRQARSSLLEIVSDANHDMAAMKKAMEDYLGLLHGFLQACDDQGGDSKLRYVQGFKWTSSLTGYTASAQQDALFELLNICEDVGLWYTKHASKLAGKEDINTEEAKEIHRCLKTAAGIFVYVKENVGKLMEQPEKGSDLDSRMIDAYIHQCTAEAQEVALARAIEMKHNSGLVSSLAYETSSLFSRANDSLESLDQTIVAKWRKYLQLKHIFYLAYAHSFNGETLLAKDKCGEAIRSLRESQQLYEKTSLMCKEYSNTKGAGTTAKPQEHLFFRRLGPLLKRTLEKCERENGFIYHQKVPEVVPELEKKAVYGLAAPDTFQLPPANPCWTPKVYGEFDVAKAPQDAQAQVDQKSKEEKVEPVKEADIAQSTKDPKNSSGCVVS